MNRQLAENIIQNIFFPSFGGEMAVDNANPTIFETKPRKSIKMINTDENSIDEFEADEIFGFFT